MRKVGAYCRTTGAGFTAALAAVDARRLVDQRTIVCHDGGAVVAGLESLWLGVAELLAATEVEEVVVWELAPVPFGISGGIRGAAPGIRAEGVVLAAAAVARIPARLSDRSAVLDAAPAANIREAVQLLVAQLSHAPDSSELQRAAAIALT